MIRSTSTDLRPWRRNPRCRVPFSRRLRSVTCRRRKRNGREYRRHGKRPNGERPRAAIPGFESPGKWMTREVADDGDQLRRVRFLSRSATKPEAVDQPPVVLVRMADQNSGGAGTVERCRQQAGRALGRIQRTPGVEDDAVALRVHKLDATTTDLARAAVDVRVRFKCVPRGPDLLASRPSSPGGCTAG